MFVSCGFVLVICMMLVVLMFWLYADYVDLCEIKNIMYALQAWVCLLCSKNLHAYRTQRCLLCRFMNASLTAFCVTSMMHLYYVCFLCRCWWWQRLFSCGICAQSCQSCEHDCHWHMFWQFCFVFWCYYNCYCFLVVTVTFFTLMAFYDPFVLKVPLSVAHLPITPFICLRHTLSYICARQEIPVLKCWGHVTTVIVCCWYVHTVIVKVVSQC